MKGLFALWTLMKGIFPWTTARKAHHKRNEGLFTKDSG